MLPTTKGADSAANTASVSHAREGLLTHTTVVDDRSVVRGHDQIDAAPSCTDGCWSAIIKAGVSFFANIDYWRTRSNSRIKYSALVTRESDNRLVEALSMPCTTRKTNVKYPKILPASAIFRLEDEEDYDFYFTDEPVTPQEPGEPTPQLDPLVSTVAGSVAEAPVADAPVADAPVADVAVADVTDEQPERYHTDPMSLIA